PQSGTSRGERSRGDNRESVGMDALAKLRVRLLAGDGLDEGGEAIEVVEAEFVVHGGIQGLGDAGVGREIHLELPDPRALLLLELLLREPGFQEAADFVQGRR